MPKLDSTKLPKAINDKYALVNSALVQAVKTDKNDSISAEIGDTKDATTFQPQLKITRWDNEVNVSFRLVHNEKNPTVEFDGEKTKWKGDKVEAHFYDKPDISEDGGHEFEVILKEDPRTDKSKGYDLEFSIETKGLEFFKQLALTPAEIAEGAVRPEDIIDSYAVYYKDCPANYVDGKLYRNGKAFHIKRIQSTDAVGTKTWHDQNIDVDKKKHVVPLTKDFLDNAAYPAVIDPTFGYTTGGGSAYGGGSNACYLSYPHTFISEDATVSKLSAYVQPGGAQPYIKGIIFQHQTNSETIISNGVGGQSAQVTSKAWKDSTFATPPTMTANTNYLLSVIVSVVDSGGLAVMYDSVAGYSMDWYNNNYATPTDFGSNYEQWLYDGYALSIYATYTAAGLTGIALTGTATSSITEANIVAGGKTIILTLTGDVWVVAAGGLFDAQRQNIINGLTSAQSETHGWNAEVKAKIAVTDVVRTSDTVVTITLDAESGYDITATETITATVPGTALLLGTGAVASPTFAITATSSTTLVTRKLLMGVGL